MPTGQNKPLPKCGWCKLVLYSQQQVTAGFCGDLCREAQIFCDDYAGPAGVSAEPPLHSSFDRVY